MGLRYFHILLIFTAIIFGFGFGVFSYRRFESSSAQLDFLTAYGSWLMAAIFSVYLFIFIRKNSLK